MDGCIPLIFRGAQMCAHKPDRMANDYWYHVFVFYLRCCAVCSAQIVKNPSIDRAELSDRHYLHLCEC